MTSKHHRNSRALGICLVLSMLAHLVLTSSLDHFKHFNLGTAVLQNQPIEVDLQEIAAATPAGESPPAPPANLSSPLESAPETAEKVWVIPGDKQDRAVSEEAQDRAELAEQQENTAVSEDQGGTALAEGQEGDAAAELTWLGRASAEAPLAFAQEMTAQHLADAAAGSVADRAAAHHLDAAAEASALTEAPLAPIRKTGEFLATEWELLTYRISMLGVPVGTAELEAKQENGEVRITLHIRSNAAASQLYPVDDSVETRHIGGNFILSRIRQREGSYRGDRGFTLFLKDKSVFWIDRVKNQSIREPLPNSAVVDILSGLYYLRNQPLEVGKPVLLQLFDSNRYVPTAVAVLRKEHLKLPGLREVDTLLVQPQLKTEGFFQRTGAILVWLTDDLKKVPVKVETRIPFGKVTAELVSAESRRPGATAAGDVARRKSEPLDRPQAAAR